MVRLQDIADELGVSLTVVSRVLNPKPDKHAYVAEATRKLVLDQASRMGYRRNRSAEFLARGGRSAEIGVFLPDAANSLIAELMMGISERANHYGFPINFFFGFDNDSYGKFLDHINFNTNSAMITYPNRVSQTKIQEPVNRYIANGGKVAFIAPYSFEFDYKDAFIVGVDNAKGAAAAARHLLERGCGEFINCCYERHSTSPRSLGFLAGINHFPVKSLELKETVEYLLQADKSHFSEHPLGVFAHSDELALQIMRGIYGSSWRIGENLLLVGYDDLFLCDKLPISLSTVKQPFRELGNLVMNGVVDLLYDRPVKRKLLSPQLICRESSMGKS